MIHYVQMILNKIKSLFPIRNNGSHEAVDDILKVVEKTLK